MQGLGGAQLSLGGDISSISGNPAGLGMYNRSDFSFSLGNGIHDTQTNFNGTPSISDSRNNFFVPNIGVVFNKTKDDFNAGKFRGGSFGISFNRINTFNYNFAYRGVNPNSSIIDSWISSANGIPEGDLYSDPIFNDPIRLAYDNFLIGPTYLLGPSGNDDTYFTDADGIPTQDEIRIMEGAQNKFTLAYGGNYDDVLFFGAALGITSFRYSSVKDYLEEFEDGPLFNHNFVETLDVRGTGINLTAGLIYRVTQQVQIGVSYTSPTWYSVFDEYDGVLFSEWDNFDYFGDGSEILTSQSAETDILISNYNLSTPSRLGLGASFFVGKNGFITADVERVNFASNRLRSRDFDPTFDNQEIASFYGDAFNLRLGGEYRINKFRLRGGFAQLGDPIAVDDGFDRTRTNINFGLGYRTRTFYIDAAYLMSRFNNLYLPYQDGGFEPEIDINFRPNTIMLTVGFTF